MSIEGYFHQVPKRDPLPRRRPLESPSRSWWSEAPHILPDKDGNFDKPPKDEDEDNYDGPTDVEIDQP